MGISKISINSTAIIGAGSWGTALARLLAQKGEKVLLWGRNAEQVKAMTSDRENIRYLPGFSLPPSLRVTGELAEAAGADCVVMVVPSHGYREVFRRLVPLLREGTLVVSAVKGIEVASRQSMNQIMHEVSGGASLHFGVLSGPSFAEEVAEGHPTAVTAAFTNHRAAVLVQHLFATEFFRVYTSGDVIGLEMCGALKNVIAIGAGICEGLGYGLNTQAALITRGLAEMTRLGVTLGAQPQTFSGLGGLGDLVLTCTGRLSRNRTVGMKLGSGKTLDQTLSEMTMVAEGVKTTHSCFHIARDLGVEMPILEQVYRVLYEGKPCSQAVRDLFQRELKPESS